MSEFVSGNETRAIRLVEYLIRLASLRTKIVRELSEDSQVLWIHKIPQAKGCFTQAWGANEEYGDIWLEVQTYREPELPNPPEICLHWINNDTIRNTRDLPALLETIMTQVKNPGWKEGSDQPQYLNQTIYLQNCHRVREEWNRYVEQKWLSWCEEHKKWEEVHDVYSTLFAIHQEQLRLAEEYELVLGLGLLTWHTPSNQRVRRHLVVANATLEFEARLGKFTVRSNPDGANLRPELDMLDIEERPVRAEEAAKAALIDAEDNPWDKNCIEEVLKALVHSINTLGEYQDRLEPKTAEFSEKPVVEYAPAIILRKRSIKGLTEVLKRMKKRIEEGETIPPQFRDMVEMAINERDAYSEEKGADDIDFGGEIYFPKPFNEEQRRIIEKMRSSNGVLVQGPPGTGKSHTIANLICHLLATGKRILVTAKTPRALKVLEGHVPEEIRPLCINLLGSGIEERKALESSVNSILQKNEESTLFEDIQRGVQKGEHQLDCLRQEKAVIANTLRAIRESETRSQSIADGAYRGTAAQIALSVKRHEREYGWLTDEVPLDSKWAVSETDLHRLLDALRALTDEKESELQQFWPSLSSIPNAQEFDSFVREELEAAEQENTLLSDIDTGFFKVISNLRGEQIRNIQDGLNELSSEIRRIKALPHDWIPAAIRDVALGNCAIWQELMRFSQQTISNLADIVEKADSTNITLPENSDIKAVYEDALVIRNHLSKGGKLGWGPFRPGVIKSIRYIIKKILVNGRRCNCSENVTLLVDALRVRIELAQAWEYWGGRSQKPGGPYNLQFRAFVFLSDTLRGILYLADKIERIKETLGRFQNIVQPIWHEESSLQKVARTCEYALATTRRIRAQDKLKEVESSIEQSWSTKRNVHAVANEVLDAVRSANVKVFASCRIKIEELNRDKECADWVKDTLSTWKRVVPNLAENLSQTYNELHWNERVKLFPDAWRWAQARTWLQDYTHKDDVSSLERREKQIESEISKTIGHIASLKAWSFCFNRMNENHRRHMVAWQQEIRRIGKGTGKWAPMHRREAQKHLNECREAVPAWIMPLHRVWDTVDPSAGMFDVIIVDEASQCGFEGIPLFYLGKKILIVGDDKQINPDTVGVPQNAINRLMEEYLHDFEFKASFDMVGSLFAHAKLRYGAYRIALREHFRCMPEIILFSNRLCYSDTPLIPLRQYGTDRLEPLKHTYLPNGYREGSESRVINRPEAKAIVDKVVELCQDERYNDKTMGVIVLQGKAQGGLIERQLLDRLGVEEMHKRRLICGDPYSFQGDERDVIFLSMVAAPNEMIGAMSRDTYERSFNVAASRARDQM